MGATCSSGSPVITNDDDTGIVHDGDVTVDVDGGGRDNAGSSVDVVSGVGNILATEGHGKAKVTATTVEERRLGKGVKKTSTTSPHGGTATSRTIVKERGLGKDVQKTVASPQSGTATTEARVEERGLGKGVHNVLASVDHSGGSSGKVEGVQRQAKTLKKLLDKIGAALAESAAEGGKQVEEKADTLAANKEEVEKVLHDHVTRLHSLIDHHHQRHRDMLRQRHKECLQQLLTAHLEAQNYESKLADLQKRVEDSLNYVTEKNDVTAVQHTDVTSLWNEFNDRKREEPEVQLPSLTYMADIPTVKGEALADLVGHFIIAERFLPSSSIPQPPTTSTQSMTAPIQAPTSQTLLKPALPPTTTTSVRASGVRAVPSTPASLQASPGPSNSSQPPAQAFSAKRSPSQPPQSPPPPPPPTPSAPTANKTSAMTPNNKQVKRLLQPLLARAASAKNKSSVVQSVTTIRGAYSQLVFTPNTVMEIAPTTHHGTWVLYCGNENHRLDLVNHALGSVSSSYSLGEAPSHVACVDDSHVLVSLPSSQQLVLLHGASVLCTMSLQDFPHKVTSISAGNTGVAVSFTNSLYWIGAGSQKNAWIIPTQKKPKLTGIRSTAVMTLDGDEMVFAAVRGTQEVVIYRRQRSIFTPLSSFKGRNVEGMSGLFSPLSISAHPSGVLAVLDSSSGDVVFLNVRTYEIMSVIAGDRVCLDVPDQLAFTPNDSEGFSALWVCSQSGLVYRTSLALLEN